jgi:hypothetical protein
MTFQMIVLWTAVLIFIATLVFIGYSIYTSQYNISWPPSIPDCPDYWTVDSDGKNCNIGSYNPCGNTQKITIQDGLCNKYQTAQGCIKTSPSFNWSGVSNTFQCS